MSKWNFLESFYGVRFVKYFNKCGLSFVQIYGREYKLDDDILHFSLRPVTVLNSKGQLIPYSGHESCINRILPMDQLQ